MATNTKLRKAEAKVQIRVMGGPEIWTDSVSYDPIMLPVEDHNGVYGPLLTDVFDSGLMALMDGLVADDPNLEFRLVWSVTGHIVKGCCPLCDDVFPVDEGFPGDELNEGVEAVCCGCDPENG